MTDSVEGIHRLPDERWVLVLFSLSLFLNTQPSSASVWLRHL